MITSLPVGKESADRSIFTSRMPQLRSRDLDGMPPLVEKEASGITTSTDEIQTSKMVGVSISS